MANQRASLAAISSLDTLDVQLPVGRSTSLKAFEPGTPSIDVNVSPLEKYSSEKSTDDDLMVPLSLRIPLGVKKRLEALKRSSITPSEFARDWIEYGLKQFETKKS